MWCLFQIKIGRQGVLDIHFNLTSFAEDGSEDDDYNSTCYADYCAEKEAELEEQAAVAFST